MCIYLYIIMHASRVHIIMALQITRATELHSHFAFCVLLYAFFRNTVINFYVLKMKGEERWGVQCQRNNMGDYMSIYIACIAIVLHKFAESYLCMIYLLGQGLERHSQEYTRSIRRKPSSPVYRYILRQYNAPHFDGI